MRWVIYVVELSTPTEKIIGPFSTSDDATAYLTEAHDSGRVVSEQWQMTTVLPVEQPYT